MSLLPTYAPRCYRCKGTNCERSQEVHYEDSPKILTLVTTCLDCGARKQATWSQTERSRP